MTNDIKQTFSVGLVHVPTMLPKYLNYLSNLHFSLLWSNYRVAKAPYDFFQTLQQDSIVLWELKACVGVRVYVCCFKLSNFYLFFHFHLHHAGYFRGDQWSSDLPYAVQLVFLHSEMTGLSSDQPLRLCFIALRQISHLSRLPQGISIDVSCGNQTFSVQFCVLY